MHTGHLQHKHGVCDAGLDMADGMPPCLQELLLDRLPTL